MKKEYYHIRPISGVAFLTYTKEGGASEEAGRISDFQRKYIYNLIKPKNKKPPESLNFDCFLVKNKKPSDYLMEGIGLTRGLLVSNDFLKIIQKFRTAPHCVYPLKFVYRKKWYSTHSYVFFYYSIYDYVDYKQSIFHFHESGKDFPIKFDNYQQSVDFENERKKLYLSKLVLKANIEWDIFCLAPIYFDVLFSEKAKEILEEAKLTGFGFKKTKIEIDF